jgi:hypothetical protein
MQTPTEMYGNAYLKKYETFTKASFLGMRETIAMPTARIISNSKEH